MYNINHITDARFSISIDPNEQRNLCFLQSNHKLSTTRKPLPYADSIPTLDTEMLLDTSKIWKVESYLTNAMPLESEEQPEGVIPPPSELPFAPRPLHAAYVTTKQVEEHARMVLKRPLYMPKMMKSPYSFSGAWIDNEFVMESMSRGRLVHENTSIESSVHEVLRRFPNVVFTRSPSYCITDVKNMISFIDPVIALRRLGIRISDACLVRTLTFQNAGKRKRQSDDHEQWNCTLIMISDAIAPSVLVLFQHPMHHMYTALSVVDFASAWDATVCADPFDPFNTECVIPLLSASAVDSLAKATRLAMRTAATDGGAGPAGGDSNNMRIDSGDNGNTETATVEEKKEPEAAEGRRQARVVKLAHKRTRAMSARAIAQYNRDVSVQERYAQARASFSREIMPATLVMPNVPGHVPVLGPVPFSNIPLFPGSGYASQRCGVFHRT